jgi:hypothetical protein
MINAYSILANGELHAFDDAVELVSTRPGTVGPSAALRLLPTHCRGQYLFGIDQVV